MHLIYKILNQTFNWKIGKLQKIFFTRKNSLVSNRTLKQIRKIVIQSIQGMGLWKSTHNSIEIKQTHGRKTEVYRHKVWCLLRNFGLQNSLGIFTERWWIIKTFVWQSKGQREKKNKISSIKQLMDK
jgi:hypothetical protein